MSESNGLHVLLVEDNPEERWLFAELLRSRGHSVTACEDAETGWDAFLEGQHSLIILDWMLPGMDGLELCRRIRAEAEGGNSTIVMVTAKNSPKDLQEVMEAGADDFVAKPVDVGLMEIRLAVAEERVRKAGESEIAKQALESKTQELEALFQNLDEVFFSIDTSRKALTQISPAVERLVGIDPETLLQEDGLWRNYLCPPEVKDSLDCLEEVFPDGPLESEYPITRPDGEVRWVRIALKPAFSTDGTLFRVDGLLSDITLRKRVEEELSARNLELLSLYEISEITQRSQAPEVAIGEILEQVSKATGFPIAILERLDPDREVLVAAAAYGITLPDDGPVEIPLHETLSGLAVEERRAVAIEEAKSHPRFKADFLRRLGIRSHLAFPLTYSKGVQGVLTLADTQVREIPDRLIRWGESLAHSLASYLERVEAEEALRLGEHEALALAKDLRRANDELEAFAYSVSHDLRAPLRTMQGFAHALLQEHGSSMPPQAQDFVRRIIDSGRQSEGLIRDLLAYSRMSFEELKLQEVDLNQALVDAREQVAAYLGEAGATLEVSENLPQILAHHTTLVQVLANLLSNAVKFVPEGTTPEVEIGWEECEDGTCIRLWIQDNGIGVPPDQFERIFKVFERLEGEVDRPGTGIGLAIVRRGMERVGGKVGLESSLGKGSRFWLQLPKGPSSRWRPWKGRSG